MIIFILSSVWSFGFFSNIHIFKDVINIKECQFVQNIVGKVDLMVVRAKGYSQKDEKKIIGYVNSYLGNKIILNIKYTEKIPRTSNGKLRFVVSNLVKKN